MDLTDDEHMQDEVDTCCVFNFDVDSETESTVEQDYEREPECEYEPELEIQPVESRPDHELQPDLELQPGQEPESGIPRYFNRVNLSKIL